jgi:dTDP-4-amino-4,6-dideoxygalactose transaminase
MAGISSVMLPYEPEWSKAVYHLYVIRTADRDKLQKQLNEAGISTGLHYPVPLNQQKDYSSGAGTFAITEKVAAEILSLPMFPPLQLSAQQTIASLIKNKSY